MLLHSGIRVIEPELFEGYDPHKKMFLHQVALDRDMAWLEVSSKADAEEYRAHLGHDKVGQRNLTLNDAGDFMIGPYRLTYGKMRMGRGASACDAVPHSPFPVQCGSTGLWPVRCEADVRVSRFDTL
jgi:hypothetical protein